MNFKCNFQSPLRQNWQFSQKFAIFYFSVTSVKKYSSFRGYYEALTEVYKIPIKYLRASEKNSCIATNLAVMHFCDVCMQNPVV